MKTGNAKEMLKEEKNNEEEEDVSGRGTVVSVDVELYKRVGGRWMMNGWDG